MSLTLQDVTKVASLARLDLSEAELQQYLGQLSAILEAVDKLEELDIANVPPTAHAVARQNVWREDEIVPPLPPAEVLFNAPQQADNQFLIQAVLEE
jgi:aspartyl-tRNA(Asn)/glutamyl-tRNA(Gln) amidotransferase subunit C